MKKEQKTLSRIFIYLTILVIIISTSVFLFAPNLKKAEVKSIAYTLVINELDEDFKDSIKVGDKIVSCVTKRAVGTVSDITVSQSKKEVYSEKSGIMRFTQIPGVVDLTLTLVSDAEVDNGLFAGGVELKMGKRAYLFSRGLYFEGKIGEIYD